MPEKIEKCQRCGHDFPIRYLRFVRGEPGQFTYACKDCRDDMAKEKTEAAATDTQ